MKKKIFIYLLLAFSLFGYRALGLSPRCDFVQLITLYGGLFLAYWTVFRFADSVGIVRLIIASFVFRLVLLDLPPLLSDDYFRFLWDGHLLANGYNPFLYLPSELLNGTIAADAGLTNELFVGLNSPSYYTVYPPINQLIFALSAYLFPDNNLAVVMIIRGFIILAEAGTAFLLLKLADEWKIPRKNVLLYLFNPLVIIELTGNLHFEALVVFFLLLCVWLLNQRKYLWGALAFAGAVATKLLPFILLPWLLHKLGWKKGALFAFAVIVLTLLSFLPFTSPALIENIFSSIHLYFDNFEFNASIYYLVREIGFWFTGYNIISWAGIGLSLLSTFAILFISYKSKAEQLWTAYLFILSSYLLLSTTVHPWYIVPLLAFTLFTGFRFAILWSGLIMLSYFTYRQPLYDENLWLTALEYVLVGGAFLYELRLKQFF